MDKLNSKEEQSTGVKLPVSTSPYFTEQEVEHIRKSSLPLPYFVYDGTNENNIVEMNQVVALSGMASNNGTVAEITVYKHKKIGNETVKEKLVYELVRKD